MVHSNKRDVLYQAASTKTDQALERLERGLNTMMIKESWAELATGLSDEEMSEELLETRPRSY